MIRKPPTPERLIALLRDGQVSEFLAHARMLEPADLADVLASPMTTSGTRSPSCCRPT